MAGGKLGLRSIHRPWKSFGQFELKFETSETEFVMATVSM